jgi:radical SAM superfamily enzyme YgiQ (UPF0313 family)
MDKNKSIACRLKPYRSIFDNTKFRHKELEMNVLFIDSIDGVESASKPLASWTRMQFGISHISSLLKAHGHETRLLVLGSNKWKESTEILKTSMEEFDPGIICYTAVFSQYSFIEKIASFIRSHWPDKFAVIGGVHTTLNPEAIIKGPFDALCVGEGEYPVLELCSQLEGKQVPQGIANLWLKSGDGKINQNRTREFIQNLDTLPFPDRKMWEPWVQEQTARHEMYILVGRGCPYDCTYCSNHAIRKVAQGKYVRMRSPENILEEIAFVYNNYPARRIFLEAEAIALDKAWALEFCRQLESFNATIGNALTYGCNFRVSKQSMDERIFIALEKANFNKINIGLESGSERVRREVLRRNYSNDDFLKTVSMARKHKLKVNVYNLIGIPGESLSDHMETVHVNHQCQPDELCTSIFFPYPGTDLYKICIKRGLIKNLENTSSERRSAVLDLPEFSKTQIQTAYKRFHRRVYKGRYPKWMLLLWGINKRIPSKVKSSIRNSLLYDQIVRLPIVHKLREKVKSKLSEEKKA